MELVKWPEERSVFKKNGSGNILSNELHAVVDECTIFINKLIFNSLSVKWKFNYYRKMFLLLNLLAILEKPKEDHH